MAAVGDFGGKADFEAAYAAAFKDSDFPTAGAYSGPADACASIIIQALTAVLTATPDADPAAIREGVRAYVTDTTHTFDTVLGTESFDELGDTNLSSSPSMTSTRPSATGPVTGCTRSRSSSGAEPRAVTVQAGSTALPA